MLFGQEHIDRYIATDGAEGHDWEKGSQVLLLTTNGRKSGEERIAPLIYGRSGDDLLIVASKGGADEAPAWFLNIEADPAVEVQVKGDRFPARARIATDAEKPAMWTEMVSHWPNYDQYQTKTERPIPIVVLERQS